MHHTKTPYNKLANLLCLFFSSSLFAASNFTISPTPGEAFPNTYPSGGTASVFYTITNLTQSTRSGYTITGLPAAVTQNTSGDNCPQSITLVAGSSCTLQLDISADVTSSFALCNGSSCTRASTPLNLHAASTPSPLFAVGSYNGVPPLTSGNPLLAISLNAGTTWRFPAAPSQPDTSPAFASSNGFHGVSCDEGTCLAVGDYFDGTTTRPLMARSTDGGDTWSFPPTITQPVTTPAFGSFGTLLSVSYSDGRFIAAGYYRDTSGAVRPLIARSADSGATWDFPASITQPVTTPAFSGFGLFLNASCNNATCIAIGAYQDTSFQFHPLIARSSDSGETWSFPESASNPTTTPAFASSGFLRGASCADATCIITGTYIDTSGTERPLLGLSTDAGATWSYPQSITEPTTDPVFTRALGFDATSCDGTLCVAAGHYESGLLTRPILALTTDSGSTWNFPTSTTNPTTTPAYDHSGRFNAASCKDTTCAVVGFYSDGTTNRPMLALSTNSGTTWSFPRAITEPTTTPAFVASGTLHGVNCTRKTQCVAVGNYSDGTTTRPLLAVTTDAGATWTFPSSITELDTTPTFTNDGVLRGVF